MTCTSKILWKLAIRKRNYWAKCRTTRRVLKTPYAMKIEQFEQEGMTLEQYAEMTSEKQHIKGAIEGDMENGFINSGQIAGIIEHIPSVKELLESMMKEANEQINKAANAFNQLNK